MRLMAKEITNKEFKKVVRGYDVESVDEHLNLIEESYQALFRENQDLTKRVEILNEKIEHYVKIEDTIQSALILAQDTSKQVKLSAEKEAEHIIKNANESAQKILDKAQEDIIKLMIEALNKKKKSRDIPVMAVITCNQKIIALGKISPLYVCSFDTHHRNHAQDLFLVVDLNHHNEYYNYEDEDSLPRTQYRDNAEIIN